MWVMVKIGMQGRRRQPEFFRAGVPEPIPRSVTEMHAHTHTNTAPTTPGAPGAHPPVVPGRKDPVSDPVSDPVRPSQTFEILKNARHGKNYPVAQAALVDRKAPIHAHSNFMFIHNCFLVIQGYSKLNFFCHRHSYSGTTRHTYKRQPELTDTLRHVSEPLKKPFQPVKIRRFRQQNTPINLKTSATRWLGLPFSTSVFGLKTCP